MGCWFQPVHTAQRVHRSNRIGLVQIKQIIFSLAKFDSKQSIVDAIYQLHAIDEIWIDDEMCKNIRRHGRNSNTHKPKHVHKYIRTNFSPATRIHSRLINMQFYSYYAYSNPIPLEIYACNYPFQQRQMPPHRLC